MKTDDPIQAFPNAIETVLKEAIQIGKRCFSESRNLEPTIGPYTHQVKATPYADNPLDSLTDNLYRHWYIQPTTPKDTMGSPLGRNFCEMLRAAHQGSYRWEAGWQAVKVSSAGRVVARRGKEERILTTTDYISLKRPGLPPPPGSSIEVVARRDSQSVAPGFWVTQTAIWEDVDDQIVRLYWNILPEGAPLLVRELTGQLDDDLPYCLKLPSRSSDYDRVDTAVLYFPASGFNALIHRLKHIYGAVDQHLHPEVPKLTLKLADGLGIAEDPPDEDQSFGLHRCRLVAQGIADAFGANTREPDEVLGAIQRRFLVAGIPPQRPHMNGFDGSDYYLGDMPPN